MEWTIAIMLVVIIFLQLVTITLVRENYRIGIRLNTRILYRLEEKFNKVMTWIASNKEGE
jgi:hypothetical protein